MKCRSHILVVYNSEFILGASNIHVLEPGVKINGAYYRDVVLRQMLLPDILAASGSEFFVFQQDSAPSYRAEDTVVLLDEETPNFIPQALWPPNSPDLNPVDYAMWNVLQERVYHTKISDVDKLKRRINSEWAALRHAVIERAVGEWRQRLYAIAFMLEADILSTCCSKDDVM